MSQPNPAKPTPATDPADLPGVVRITDPDDPRLRDYVHLTDLELRKRTEPEEGLFIAEGDKVIRRAITAGYPVRSLLLSDKWLPLMAPVIAEGFRDYGAPAFVGSPDLLEKVTGFHVHRGALAALGRLPLPDPELLLAESRRIAVLEKVNNHTNIGAIFRSAAALGMDAVLLAPDCADPLYRRAVRVSMGTVFAVPYAKLEPWPAALDLLVQHGYRRMALTPAADAVDLRALRLGPDEKVALFLGSEGDGLSDAAFAACDLRVRIPMSAGVDSLNVAAAAAVACFALLPTDGADS